jgi:anti-sigma B factor antagonist
MAAQSWLASGSLAMPIKKLQHAEDIEYLVSGRIDGAVANELEVELLQAIKAGATNIYVNLAESDFLCSAGIRVLLQYHRQMKAAGKRLLVARPSPNVRAAIELTGFTALIEQEG